MLKNGSALKAALTLLASAQNPGQGAGIQAAGTISGQGAPASVPVKPIAKPGSQPPVLSVDNYKQIFKGISDTMDTTIFSPELKDAINNIKPFLDDLKNTKGGAPNYKNKIKPAFEGFFNWYEDMKKERTEIEKINNDLNAGNKNIDEIQSALSNITVLLDEGSSNWEPNSFN